MTAKTATTATPAHPSGLIPAAKYRRISDDREGRELGVTRQDEELDTLAERRGYVYVASYVDNDKGASTKSKKKRPEYAAMIADAKAGKFAVIAAATSNRLTRRPREYFDQEDLAVEYGVRFDFVKSPSFDLNTSAGRRIARTLAMQDAGEAEDISERVQAARLQQAKTGKFGGGGRRFGFEADGVTVRADEAAEIAKWSDDVVGGVSLYAITADLRARGVATVTGAPWTPGTVRDILLRPRNAGLMVYRGDVVEDAEAPWAPIVERETWDAVRSVLTNPGRRTSPGNRPKWLGSGLYRCGHVDCVADETTPTAIRAGTAGNRPEPAYRCMRGKTDDNPGRKLAHLTRDAAAVDAYVEETILARLERPDAAALLAPTPHVDTTALAKRANVLRERITEAGDMWEAGEISRVERKTRVDRMQAELDEIEATTAAAGGRDPLAGLAGNRNARKVWAGLGLDRQRAVLDAVAVVTILPAPRGRRPSGQYFDPEFVRVEPKPRDA